MAQDKSHPVIPTYGAIVPAPDAANQPDQAQDYRVVFSITKAGDDAAKVNPGLDRVARFVNLLGSSGIQARRGHLIAIIHGKATPLVLSEAAYKVRFGISNPNVALIAALRKEGVEVHVCSQSLAGNKIDRDAVSADVTVDLSAMTTLATLQLKGWALISD